MNYREPVRATVDSGWPNLVGIAVASVAVSATLLPLLATAALGTLPALVGGLWTTCLLFGVALVGLFRFVTGVADHGVQMNALPHLVAAIKNPRAGLELGVATFVVVVVALSTGFVPDTFRAAAVGFGVFFFAIWYLFVGFAAPEFGAGAGVRPAVQAGAARFARSPLAASWFLLLSVVCSTVAGVTVVTAVVFLPGVLGLLATHVAVAVAAPAELPTDDPNCGK